MVPWVLFKNCVLIREDNGALRLKVGCMEQMQTKERPRGIEINPKVAGGQEFQKFLNSSGSNSFDLGNLRPGVGGMFEVPFELLDFGGDHKRVLKNLQDKFGKIDVKQSTMVAAVRGLGAPGTFGVIDGGGAGILEGVPHNTEDIVFQCMVENFGEIGIENPSGKRVGFFLTSLDRIVVSEWRISWGSAPDSFCHVDFTAKTAQDEINIEGLGTINCALAFEPENASVEILRWHEITWPPNTLGQLSFRDLEHAKTGVGLNRSVAVVCRGSYGLFVLFYKAGKFVEDLEIPLRGDCYDILTNSKSKKLVSLFFGPTN